MLIALQADLMVTTGHALACALEPAEQLKEMSLHMRFKSLQAALDRYALHLDVTRTME